MSATGSLSKVEEIVKKGRREDSERKTQAVGIKTVSVFSLGLQTPQQPKTCVSPGEEQPPGDQSTDGPAQSAVFWII